MLFIKQFTYLLHTHTSGDRGRYIMWKRTGISIQSLLSITYPVTKSQRLDPLEPRDTSTTHQDGYRLTKDSLEM